MKFLIERRINMGKKDSGKLDYTINVIVKIFIISAIMIAVGILIFTFINFTGNQKMFTESFDETLDIFIKDDDDFVSYTEELLTLRMQYLEKISELHKQASNNDLFVFMYGFLSSVLIGISAYMVKKGQEQLETLSGKYNEIGITANNIENRLNSHDNSIKINLIMQTLSDALLSIVCYNIALGIGDLIRFKQNLREVAKWCEDIDFSKINRLTIDKFGQNLGTIKSVYDSASIKEGSEIDEVHKANVYKDFAKIEKKLIEKSEK